MKRIGGGNMYSRSGFGVKLTALVLALCAGGASAATIKLGVDTPVAKDGVQNLSGAADAAGNVNLSFIPSDYVAGDNAAMGQLFTTGPNSSGYRLTALSFRQVSYYTWWRTGASTIAVRVFSLDGATSGVANLTVLAREEGTVPGTDSGNQNGTPGASALWVTLTLATPVTLSPNTRYGFDIEAHGTGGAGPFFMEWDGTGTDALAGGQACGGGANGTPATTAVWLGDGATTGDRVFVATMRKIQVVSVLGTNSVLRLDASTLGLTNNAPVSGLSDSSVTHNDAVAHDAANLPSYNAANFNGLGTIHLNGGTQGLRTQANVGIAGDQDRALFVIMRRADGFPMMAQLGVVPSANQAFGIDAGVESTWIPYTYGAGDATTGTRPAGTYELFAAVRANGTSVGFINGGQVTSNTGPIATVDAVARIGWRGDTKTATGDFAEMIVCNRGLEDAERQQVEAYLNYKWFGTGDGVGNLLPVDSAITFTNGLVLDLSGENYQTLASLASTDGLGSELVLGTARLTISDASDSTFDGAISGFGGSLIKTNSGTLILSGTNSYTGVTRIEAGRLALGNAQALPAVSAVTLVPGATLDLGAHDAVCASLSGSGTLRLAPAGSLTMAGPLTASLEIEISDPQTLNAKVEYTLVTCSGTPSGTYSLKNIPFPWAVRAKDGRLVLQWGPPTMIRIY